MKRIIVISLLLFLIFSSFIHLYSQGEYYYKQGIDAYNNANYEVAEKYLTLSLAVKGIDDALLPQMYYALAQSVYHNSRFNYTQSISLLDTAILIDRSYCQAYFLRGRIRVLEFGLNKQSDEDFKKAMANTSSKLVRDIYYKSLSKYFLKGVSKALLELNETRSAASLMEVTSINPESDYSLAALYSLAGNNLLALNYLDFALKGNYNKLDFIFMDFYNMRENPDFLKLMDKYKINEIVYKTMSTEERIIKEKIKNHVERKINNWQKKGKFEKSVAYQSRVNENARDEKVKYYTRQAIDSIGSSMINWDQVSNEYDADNESFKITFQGFNPLYVGVPLPDAPSFDANFDSLEFEQIKFVLLDDYTIDLLSFEITNSKIGKTYIFNSSENVPFNSTEFAFNFDEIEVPIVGIAKTQAGNSQIQNTKIISVGKSDVDTNIPKTDLNNSNTYALIIGNEDYTKYQTNLSSESNVDYAIRDAEIFAEYAEKTLGIPGENITILKDAISSQMQREIEKISKISKYHNGEANIIFYYAGHGFPDETTKESYLMPVDVSGTDVKYGIKLSYLYQQLTQYPSQKVLVILDACFSGGGRNQGLLAARGVKIKPKENVINGNLVVFSSSTGEQSSLPYQNKQHGMFTYFLLKKLKESKGEITLEELSDYVTKEVQINALKINSKEQNPNILVSPDVGNLWMDWKLN